MKKFDVFDMHCDTLTACFDQKKSLYKNDLHIDIQAMQTFKSYTQFFAVFISPLYYDNPKKRCLEVIRHFHKEIDDLKAFLAIEGGEAIQNFDDLELFYRIGVRMITLTWNNDNHIAGANGSDKGLTDFGKGLIPKMNDMGIIIDLSHSSKQTFYDVIKITKKPVVFSHSNSYSICPHQRNITDEQFEKLKAVNGVVGINYYPPFLSKRPKADIYDVIKHIEYFLSLGGEDNIGLGSDFAGIDTTAEGLNSISDVDKIFNILSRRKISDEVIEKIAYKNICRIISICL